MKNRFKKEKMRKIYKKGFLGILSLFLLAGVSYAYNVNTTVMQIVERRQLESKIAELSTELAELQYDHTTFENKITLDTAEHLGFDEALDVIFVERLDSRTALTFNAR